MTKEPKRREPLPGETIYGAKLVDGRAVGGRLEHGPRAFFVVMGPDCGVLCDPDRPIEHGSRVLMTLKDGSRFDCTVLTKHPARAKSLRVQMVDGGAVLRGVRKEWLTRVMSFSYRGSFPRSVGSAAL